MPGDGGVDDRLELGRGHGVDDKGDATAVTTTAGEPPTDTMGARPGTDDLARRHTFGGEGSDGRPARRWGVWVVAVLAVLPILVLVVALAQRTWYPTGDLAQAELRMHSLPRHPPLVGAAGRIFDQAGRQGNHPGPLMYWAMWPIYKLLGSSSWAMEAATALINAAWLAVAVWMAWRRRGNALAWWTAVIGVLLVGGYGLDGISQPWNPWAGLMSTFALAIAVWSLLDGDRWMLPVAVVAASYGFQGDVSYAVVVPLLAFGVVGLVWRAWSDRRAEGRAPTVCEDDARREASSGRAIGRWVVPPAVVAIVVGLFVWSGPIADVFHDHPTNASKLLASFRHPRDPILGWSHGIRVTLAGLNPVGLWITGHASADGTVVPGLLLLVVWAALAIAVRRRAEASLNRLNVAAGAFVVSSGIAISRIIGYPYLYTYRWLAATTAVIVLAVGWSAARLIRDAGWAAEPRRLLSLGLAVLVVVAAVTSVRLARTDIPYLFANRLETPLARATAKQIDPHRRYLIRWDDPAYLGGLGYGLLLDLEGRGVRVGVDPQEVAGAEPHRVMCPGDYDQVITVVTTDSRIAAWRAKPGAREIAAAPTHTAERDEATRRDRDIIRGHLRAIRQPPTDADIDAVLNSVLLDASVPKAVRLAAARLTGNGLPSAVFVTEPGQAQTVAHSATTETCWKHGR